MPVTHTAQKLRGDKSQLFCTNQHMCRLCVSRGFNQILEIQDEWMIKLKAPWQKVLTAHTSDAYKYHHLSYGEKILCNFLRFSLRNKPLNYPNSSKILNSQNYWSAVGTHCLYFGW